MVYVNNILFLMHQVKWKCKKNDDTNGGYSSEILTDLFNKVTVISFFLSSYFYIILSLKRYIYICIIFADELL